jgi:hypothetical protein
MAIVVWTDCVTGEMPAVVIDACDAGDAVELPQADTARAATIAKAA